MFSKDLISDLVYQRLLQDLKARLDETKAAMELVYAADREHFVGEVARARVRLMAAEKSSVERALREGLISASTAAKMIDKADAHYRQLSVGETPPAPEKQTVTLPSKATLHSVPQEGPEAEHSSPE
jgi:hypothetical protein